MKNWFVCRNKNGAYYKIQSQYQSLQESWDREGYQVNAVYGPCDVASAENYIDDMTEINKDSIKFTRPDPNTIITSFDDDQDDGYAGLIS